MTVKGHIRGPQVVLCAEHCCEHVQDAKAQLQHVLSKDPCNGHAWHTLGQMAEETGDLEQAAQCYTDGTQGTGWPSLHPAPEQSLSMHWSMGEPICQVM